MKPFLAFTLILLSFGLYLYLETKTGFSQNVPWLHYGIALVGVGLLVKLLRANFNWWRCTLTSLGVIFTAGFVWWTLSYSSYGEAPQKTAKTLPENIILVNRQATEVDLGVLLGRFDRTLAIFYRGYW